MSNWSYEILCDDDAMEAFYKLVASDDLARDIEAMLDKHSMRKGNKYADDEHALVAAAMVAVSVGDPDWDSLSNIDLDTDDGREEYEKNFEPFLDQVRDTDLSHLKQKAVKVLKNILNGNSAVTEWWYEEDCYIEWLELVDYLMRVIKNA